MKLKLGIHTGPQDLSMEELQRIWRRAEEAGFHWVSVWDHFYANPLQSRENPCFEAVAAMAALAATTQKVRVGCLVFCALFRNPGLLAKAAITIDHISRGRAEIGIGAGWFEEEFQDFGYSFPRVGKRLDQLEEVLRIIHSLWHDPVTNFKGDYYNITDAVASPKPYNPKIRLWVGGKGKVRTPQFAAKYAGGFNIPYVSPETVKDRLQRLGRACEKIGRDPAELETSTNVGFFMNSGKGDATPLVEIPANIASGVISGSPQQAIDRIGQYAETGINGLNIAFRPPINWDAFESYIEEVMPVFLQK